MKNDSMMSIDKNKVLSNDNLLGLRGGAHDYLWCCLYDNNDVFMMKGESATDSCEGAYLPGIGWYWKECTIE